MTARIPMAAGTTAVPLRERARDGWDLTRETRAGRLAAHGAVALVLVVLAGLVALLAVVRTDAASSDVVGSAEPRARAAQELERSLSDADAAAAEGFLAGPAEPASTRLRYQADITAAGTALATAARAGTSPGTGTGTARADDPVVRLATGLPVYAGLVETARSADRQGLAVGGAYLREASAFLRTTLLPAARTVYDEQSAVLDADQGTADGGVLTVAAALLAVAALVAVLALHRRVARTTRRRVTPGLVLAAAAVAVGLVWGVAALGAAALFTATARADGVDPGRAAVAARFAVLQSRSDDVLTLVARGSGTAYEQAWTARSIELLGAGGLLDRAAQEGSGDPGVVAAVTEARRSASTDVVVHNRVRSLDASGNYDLAVALALSPAPDGGAASVGRTLDALGRVVDTTAATTASDDDAAAGATTLLAAGVVVLTLVAGAGIVAGLGPRLGEYR